MSDANAEAARLLATALQVEPGEVPQDAAIGTTERWDSLAHMRLVLAIEESLGKQLTTDEMLAIESYADVVTLVKQA